MNLVRRHSSRKRQRQTRPCLECLEDRFVPSHVPILTGLPDGKAAGLDATDILGRATTGQATGGLASLTAVTEAEPPGTTGQNDIQAEAQFLPGFGTGPGEDSAADITGVLKRLPRTITA